MAQQVFDRHLRSPACIGQSKVTPKYAGELGVPIKAEIKIYLKTLHYLEAPRVLFIYFPIYTPRNQTPLKIFFLFQYFF